MKKLFFIISLIVFAGNAYAHQPDVSTTLLTQQTNNQWILQVKAALTAFKYEVTDSYPKESYNSPEEFQALVIRHVMENVSIVFDGNKEVELQHSVVRLGHETNVIFEVDGVPETFKSVQFKNSSFKEIPRNQSALVILKKGFTQKQFVLNNENKHTALLKTKDGQFVSTTSGIKSTMFKSSILIGLIGLGVVGVFIFSKFKKRNNIINNDEHSTSRYFVKA